MRLLLAFLSLAACAPESHPALADLVPPPAALIPGHPYVEPQPHRDHPWAVAVDGGGDPWVSLRGSTAEPGHQVVRVDVASGALERVDVPGTGAAGLALHPGGRWLVVFLRYAHFAAVIDTHTAEVVGTLAADPYTVAGVFRPDGDELWVANRWRDEVAVWRLREGPDGLERRAPDLAIEVGHNPRDLAVSPDGGTLAVGSATGTTLSLLDARTRTERARVELGAPPSSVAFAGDWLVVATLSGATGHLADEGPDTDGDGRPGDGTPNTEFANVQNELAVLDAAGTEVWRYTSDTLCCPGPYDVAPRDEERGGALLPPRSRWIVGGALPEQVVAVRAGAAWRVYVTYSASHEAQWFAVDPGSGALRPGPVFATGLNPRGLAVRGDDLWIANHLGETLGRHDAETGAWRARLEVGDLEGGPVPATRAERGELTAFATAPSTADGDQSCVHCHREGGAVDKATSVGLLRAEGVGTRMTSSMRGMADTRPWFWEAMVDETSFRPVADGFQRSGPTDALGHYRSAGAPLDDRSADLAAWLMTDGNLLPNPNPADTAAARRGRALFFHPDVGCSGCHPPPAYAVSTDHNPAGLPLRMPPVVSAVRDARGVNLDLFADDFVAMFPRAEQDICADVCDAELCATDASACDDLREVRLGVPSLRGLWDRPPRLLHDGRATLREVLCTPGHPALRPGEVGFNERDGVPDTHGGTSHLSESDIADLMVFLESL